MSLDAAPCVPPTEADILASFPALPDLVEPPETVAQAAVFRIYPNRAQIAAFRQWIGAGRWLWNRFHEINQHLYAEEKRFAFHGELSSLLPQMKRAQGLDWLAQPPALHLVDVSRRYDAALRRFLDDRRKLRAGKTPRSKTAGFPRFKAKRDREGSIYLGAQNIRLIRRDANPHAARGWVELPNMDETVVWERTVKGGKRKGKADRVEKPLRRAIRIRGGRWPEGTIRSATIREDAPGIWVMAVQYDGPPPVRRRRGEEIAIPAPEVVGRGYDVGCASIAVGSDGSREDAPRPLRKVSRRLRRAKRTTSRRRQTRLDKSKSENKKIARSRRERRACAEEARIHRQVRNVRNDVLHKLTYRATTKSVVSCAEDLAVSGMLRNPNLALSVSDAALGEIPRQMAYKARWRGRHFVKIDRWAPSSKTCCACDHKLEDLSLSTRSWDCPACGAAHDRDENAALNILRWGLQKALRRGTPKGRRGSAMGSSDEGDAGESGALVESPTRKGKGLRRNSTRRTGNVGLASHGE